MNIFTVRKWLTDKSTISELSIESSFECYTLEDRVRATGVKIQNLTAIPEGQYKLVIDFSSRFKRYMPHLLNVPLFSGIRIHSGNIAENTEGCLLVGQQKGIDQVLTSRVAFASFFEKIANNVGYDDHNKCTIFRIKEPSIITITTSPVTDERTN